MTQTRLLHGPQRLVAGRRHSDWRHAPPARRRPSRRCLLRLAFLATLGLELPLPLSAATPPPPPQGVQGSPTGLTLSVSAMPVEDVLKLIAENGHLNLAIGPGVTGQITLFVKDRPARELVNLVVDLAGAACSVDGRVIRVMTQEAYEARYGRPYRDNLDARVFELQHVQVSDILPGLAPLRSKNGQIIEQGHSNRFVAVETPQGLAQIESVLAVVDRPSRTCVVPVQSVPPGRLAERLKAYLPPAVRIEADPAGRRMLVTGTDGAIERTQRLATLLDRSEQQDTRVFALAYASPDSIRKAIRPLLTVDIGSAWIDARTRQLVVTDFPSELETIKARIAQMDVPLRQVLLEARILQVSLDDEVKTGIDWAILQEKLNGTAVHASFPILTNLESGIRARHDLDSQSFKVVAEALETFGKTNLLSSPRIMVADGERARIHVGSQVPYVTIDTRENPNGVLDRFEKVTIVSVGVLLEVRAQVHGTDMVSLEIRPEVSSVTGYSNNIPIVETSESSSTVLVQDQHTVILGGLNRDEVHDLRQGVPILGRIPLLGYLFSSRDQRKVRTELAILLTPRILTGTEDMSPGNDRPEELKK